MSYSCHKRKIMKPYQPPQENATALEVAAKYICTMKFGMCPMAVEQFQCPQICTMDIRPWQCWVAYFTHKQQPTDEPETDPKQPEGTSGLG